MLNKKPIIFLNYFHTTGQKWIQKLLYNSYPGYLWFGNFWEWPMFFFQLLIADEFIYMHAKTAHLHYVWDQWGGILLCQMVRIQSGHYKIELTEPSALEISSTGY